MGSGLGGRTIALAVLAVVLALGLGAWAGSRSGAVAGAIAALAGLASTVVAEIAMDRRARNLARQRRQQEILRTFARPGPADDGEDQE